MGVGMDGKDVAEAVAAVAAMMGKIQNPKVKAAAKVVLKAAPAVAVAAQVAPAAAKAAAPVVKKAGRAAAGAAGAAKDKVVEVVGDGRDKMREKAEQPLRESNSRWHKLRLGRNCSRVLRWLSTLRR